MNRTFALRKRFALLVGAIIVGLIGLMSPPALAAASQPPSVFSISATSTRAVVLESVSLRGEPFSLTAEANFSPADPRARASLYSG